MGLARDTVSTSIALLDGISQDGLDERGVIDNPKIGNGTSLTMLCAGEIGTIAAIDGVRSSAKRLADLGFIHGAHVTMVRPGAPCIVRIDGRCVGLGFAHQKSIRLVPSEASESA